jgi:hypothetical protein
MYTHIRMELHLLREDNDLLPQQKNATHCAGRVLSQSFKVSALVHMLYKKSI